MLKPMKLLWIFTVTIFVSLSGWMWAEDFSQYKGGWTGESIAQMYALGTTVPPASSEPRNLPTKVDFSDEMPPVGNQGQQSSCVGWATAYAAKSYQEYAEHAWDYENETLFSPAYIYNQINGGKDYGSSIYSACQLVVNQGCATFKTMPYNVKDYKTQPNSQAKKEAAKYKAKSFATIKPNDIMTIKSYLSKGVPVVFGATLYMNFHKISKSSPVYNKIDGKALGGHAMTLVGYDDSKYGGSFKLINSWGKNWGDKGYAWIPYSFFPKVTGAVLVMEDIQEVEPEDIEKPDNNTDVVVDSDTAPSTPESIAISQGKYSDRIEITWKADTSSEKNIVLKWDEEEEKWNVIAELKDQKYADKEIEKGKYYYYSIISQNKEGYSSPTSPMSGYALSGLFRAEIDSAYAAISASQGSFDKYIVIKFGQIPSDEGYLVFRKSQKDPNWKLIASMNEAGKKQFKKYGDAKNSGELYIDQDVEAGIVYEYMVVPDIPKGVNTPSPVVKGWTKGKVFKDLPQKPSGLKTEQKGNGVQIEWKASPDTIGYYVYKWNDASKDYIKIDYTQETKYFEPNSSLKVKAQYAVKSFNWAGESKDFLK